MPHEAELEEPDHLIRMLSRRQLRALVGDRREKFIISVMLARLRKRWLCVFPLPPTLPT